MEKFAPIGDVQTPLENEGAIGAPAGIDAQQVDMIDRERTPLRHWPASIAQLYKKEIVSRLYREQHFLFLFGLMLVLATIAVDIVTHPQMAKEGAILRVLVVAPVTMLGLFAGARGWTQVLAFCVGAAPLGFTAVLVLLALQLPPELAPRYLLATGFQVGLTNLILPYSRRGLIMFDIAAVLIVGGILALNGLQTFALYSDSLLVLAMAALATLPLAARFESLRQHNFLLTLRARVASQELVEANRTLQTLAETDPLTGIANRRGFANRFDTAIAAPGEDGRRSDLVALMMIDLDHFKEFNDTHGHQAGDSCLRLVAHSLVDIFESVDGFVARYGGEEFIAALRMREQTAILAVAEEVRLTIATALTPADESNRSLVTASIGVAIAPAAAMLPREELIEMADAALYSGKNHGRNRVVCVEAEAAFGIRP